MINILCYGDSNTWGADPLWDRKGIQWRLPVQSRWTGVVQQNLGDQYHIYEEGLCNRNTAFDDTLAADCNGLKALPAVLATTHPLDLVVFMLGTNDIKRRFGLGPMDTFRAAELLINCVRTAPCGYTMGVPPKILIVAPVPVSDIAMNYEWGELFGPAGIEMSKKLPEYLKRVAEKWDCEYLNAGAYAEPNPTDGVHLDAENHHKLGLAITAKIRGIFEGQGTK